MKKIIKITAILLATVVLGSCADIDEKEKGRISTLPDSDEGAAQYVTGVYSYLLDDMFRWDQFPKVLDVDNDYNTGPDWSLGAIGSGNFVGDDAMDPCWMKPYVLIHRANNAIEKISEMKNLSEGVKENAIGECKFLKAWGYFILVRAYGAVPVFRISVNAGADYNQPRQSIATVWEYIIELLKDAQNTMWKNTDPQYKSGHASAGAAASLLAKSYLTIASASLASGEVTVKGGQAFVLKSLKNEENNDVEVKILKDPVAIAHQKNQVAGYESFNSAEYFTLAAEKAEEIMNGDWGAYFLSAYDMLWKASNQFSMGEHIWGIKGVVGDDRFGIGIHKYYSGTLYDDGSVNEGMFYGNTNAWYRLFEKDDYRIVKGVKHQWQYGYQRDGGNGSFYPTDADWSIKARGYWVQYDTIVNRVTNIYSDPITGEPYVVDAQYDDGLSYTSDVTSMFLAFTTKYDDVTDPMNSRSDDYWPVLRYADVLLMYAEAANEAAGAPTTEALNALNNVRLRSNATPFEMSQVNTLEKFRSAVLEERARELNLEGDRRWDLIRWGIYLQVMNAIGGYDESGVRKVREERNLLYPIPVAEMNSNTNIGNQNPGWTV